MIKWSAAAGATGYRVYRDGVKLADLTGLSYADQTAEIGKIYVYKVVAYNAAGESPGGGSVTVQINSSITDMSGVALPFGVLDLIRAAMDYVQVYALWILLGLAVVFAPWIWRTARGALKPTKDGDYHGRNGKRYLTDRD